MACKAFKQSTAIGVDAISFRELVGASTESKTAVLEILKDVDRQAAWPTQVLGIDGALIPKKIEGLRVIGVAPSLYRIRQRLARPSVAEWDEANSRSDDTAKHGTRLDDETSLRHVRLEIATPQGKNVTTLLWDITKLQRHHETDEYDQPRGAGQFSEGCPYTQRDYV